MTVHYCRTWPCPICMPTIRPNPPGTPIEAPHAMRPDSPAAPSALSDADVERIADRVAEKLARRSDR